MGVQYTHLLVHSFTLRHRPIALRRRLSPGLPLSIAKDARRIRAVIAQPDVARITLGIDVFDPSLSRAQAMASTSMDAVVNKLKADGILDTDIRTVSFNINPQYDQQNQNQPVLRGYQVQNLVEVKTTNVAGLGPLIDDAVASGATRVNGIRFEASDMAGLKSQARDQAMQDARAQADQLARDAGVTLGKPISIEISDTGGVTPVRAFAPGQAVMTTALFTGVSGSLR